MSASREKIKRREERSEGTEKRQVRAKKSRKEQKKNNIIKTISGTVIAIILVLLILFNSSLLYSGLTAVSMGTWKFKNTDFNYEYFSNYYNTYSQISSTYGQYASMLLDNKKPLNQQKYSETQTWDDYFEQSALNSLQQMAILYDKGKAAGFQLSSDQQDVIKTTITGMKRDATNNKYKDFNKYLKSMYGNGLNEELLTKLLTTSYYATYYSQQLVQQWKDSYTDDQKSTYYDGVRSKYDLLTYYSYYVDGSADTDKGIDKDTAMASANNIAQAIAAAATEDDFVTLVQQNCPEDQKATYADPNACRHEDVAPSTVSNNDWLTWLTDSSRGYGNTKVFPSDSGYYVFLYIGSNHNDYNLKNYRSIVIPVQKNADTGEITNDAIQAAKKQAEDIISKFNDNKTEDNFSKLTDTYKNSASSSSANDTSNNSGSSSSDSSNSGPSATDSGLYQNVNMSQLSGGLKNYIFSSDRHEGEVGYIYTNKTYYVIYMLKDGVKYNLSLAENLMAQDDYKKLIDDASASYPISTKFVFKFAKKV